MVRLTEYEPLSIRLFAGRDFKREPDVLLDGMSIGSARVTPMDNEIVWEWEYRSESWCGRSHLVVNTDDGPIEVVVMTVPSGTKYSEDEYDRMIARLLAYHSDIAWGVAPGLSQVQESSKLSPAIAVPSLLQHYLDPLLRQLQRILDEPVLASFREEILRAFDPTRPLKPHTLRWLSAHPSQAKRVGSGNLDVLLPQQRQAETHDHPANRYVKTVVSRLLQCFERTASTLETFPKGRPIGDHERARCSHLAHRVRAASERLRSALQHPVLEAVVPGPMTEGAAQVFSGYPHYARFGRIARRLLSTGIELTSTGRLEASLRRSWDLFELYCLHRLVERLEAALGDSWRYDRSPYLQALLCAPDEGIFWLAVRGGDRWELRYQQFFKRGGQGPSSITVGRQPDFVLSHSSDGTLDRWLLLDAKYRSSELSLNQALESMHIYRDSLRWNANAEPLRAAGGYLLVPCIIGAADKYATADFLNRWQIGLIDIEDESLGARLLAVSRLATVN